MIVLAVTAIVIGVLFMVDCCFLLPYFVHLCLLPSWFIVSFVVVVIVVMVALIVVVLIIAVIAFVVTVPVVMVLFVVDYCLFISYVLVLLDAIVSLVCICFQRHIFCYADADLPRFPIFHLCFYSVF
jgi:hypothetical protein